MPIVLVDHSPQTLEEAVDILVSNMNEEEKSFVKLKGTHLLHHGIGRDIRNDWQLWQEDSVLHKHFKETYQIWHADDMSGLIFTALEQRLNGKDIDISITIQSYHDHWQRMGYDPFTGEKV